MDEYVYPANKKNLKAKGDYGIRVAKWGYDASACSDGQLLFNSNWPIIQIAKMQKIDGEPKLIGSTEYPTISDETPYELNEEYDRDIAGVDRRYVYTKAHIRKYSYYGEYDPEHGYTPYYEFFQFDLYGFTHGLGYAPMFFSEQDFNGYDPTHNRVVLTNIDITKDVDYPYVSKPSIDNSYPSDYGIKSKAYYTGKFPKTGSMAGVGLSTAIQGKQIMAVKTQETIATEGWAEHTWEDETWTDPPSCVYYPPTDDDGKPIIKADQFEYYGFVSNMLALLRSPENFNAGGGMGGGDNGRRTNAFDPLRMGYGDIYFRSVVFPLPFSSFETEMTGARLMPADWFWQLERGNWVKQTLIAVRVPMVSPNVVNVEVV